MRSGFIKMYNILRKSSWKFSQSFVIRSIALLSDIQSNRLKIKQTLIESYSELFEKTQFSINFSSLFSYRFYRYADKSIVLSKSNVTKFTSRTSY